MGREVTYSLVGKLTHYVPAIFRQRTFQVVCLFIVTSCAAQKPVTEGSYSEDLSKNRPKFAVREDSARKDTTSLLPTIVVTPTRYVNGKVDAILDSIDRFNRTRPFVDGFTVQIYSGQRREDAVNTKAKMQEDIPDLTANLQYTQPKFRVTVGRYLTKLEAQRDFIRLRRVFPAAILVPEKIQIR